MKYQSTVASNMKLAEGFVFTCGRHEAWILQKFGNIYNYAFNPNNMNYTQNYENSLHFSLVFQQYAEELALRLVERYKLYNKDIIEIGSGGGNFLRLLCDVGNNRGIGFDPSGLAEKYSKSLGSSITFINDFYLARYFSCKVDFVCCRHVLEHIQFPWDFYKIYVG